MDPNHCDCKGNVLDCLGVCGGKARKDPCGNCEDPSHLFCNVVSFKDATQTPIEPAPYKPCK